MCTSFALTICGPCVISLILNKPKYAVLKSAVYSVHKKGCICLSMYKVCKETKRRLSSDFHTGSLARSWSLHNLQALVNIASSTPSSLMVMPTSHNTALMAEM